MRRSAVCKTCGKTIRAREQDLYLGSAVRKHYWRNHREVMLGGKARAERDWDGDRDAGSRTGVRARRAKRV